MSNLNFDICHVHLNTVLIEIAPFKVKFNLSKNVEN